MEKKINENSSSSGPSAETSELENSFRFMNLSFAENSDSSVQPEAPKSHSIRPDQAIRNASKSIARDYQMSCPPPNKILPISFSKLSEEPQVHNIFPEEKTLIEIGFNPNKIEDWERIKQPKKQDLYGLLKNMIDNYIKTNVQIRVGDVSFNCHMMVLQCYSDFFMQCSNEAVVQLPPERITPQAFMMVYDWMLSAEPLVQREGILELFNAANFLKIKGLVDQCWVCLDDDIRFQEDTAFLLYLDSRNYGLEMLQQLMLTRICKFFLTLVASKDFLLLSAKEVCTLLSSNAIGVNSEVEILMSAVRWLNYNWKDRQCYLIDVMKSVRFGLMPPWILVALGRDSECEEVQKVIDNSKVKKMIEDGLSYTTTQLYYSKNVDSFHAFMERYKLTKPIQRQWICDQECGYHHKTDCSNRLYITYLSFVEYLEMIRKKGKDHWKTLLVEHEEGTHYECCLPMANTSMDQYIYRIVPKGSRDQAVQASGEISDSDETDTNGISQTVDIKTSWYQEIYSSNRPNTRGLENIQKTRTQDGNNNKNNIATNRDNKNITLSQKSSSCCDVNQKPINIKKSVLAKSFYCSMSSEQEFEYSTIANSASAAAAFTKPQRHQDIVDGHQELAKRRTNMSPLKKTDDDDDADGDDEDCSITSKAASAKQIGISRKQDPRSELNLHILNQKIFIFGGIDPYAQLNPSNGQGMDVLYYDSCENAWKYLSNMPRSRHHHSAVVYRGRIYVIGGTRPPLPGSVKSIFETAVWSFDPKRLQWHNETILPQCRRDFGLVAYDNDVTSNKLRNNADQGDGKRQTRPSGLFIFGGESNDGRPLSSMLYYNVEKKIWSEVVEASLNIGRYGLASAVVNIKNTAEIWVAGGVCGHEKGGHPIITDSMESYNLTSEDGSWSWKELIIRLRIPRLFSKFCTTNRGMNLYVIGGIGLDPQHPGEFKSLASIDQFDIHKEHWNHLTDMIMSRHGHDVVAVQDNILIFGGVSGSKRKTLKSVECFSTNTNTWLYEIVFLPLALSGLTAIVIDTNLMSK